MGGGVELESWILLSMGGGVELEPWILLSMGGCCRAQVMISGCHFEANTPYTSQKSEILRFCAEK